MNAAICPWAEANQGLLSIAQGCIAVIALLVALVALWGQSRSDARAAKRRTREYVDTVLGLVDEFIRKSEETLAEMGTHPDGGVPPAVSWNHFRQNTLDALDAVRLTAPPDAVLAVAVADLRSTLPPFIDSSVPAWPPTMVRLINDVLAALRDKRSRIAARRPR